MTPESQMPDRDTPPDPLVGLQAIASRQVMAEPTAEDMSKGVLDGLRQVMSIVTTAASTVPNLAEDARGVRQLLMKMMLTVQTMTEQGNEQGGGY